MYKERKQQKVIKGMGGGSLNLDGLYGSSLGPPTLLFIPIYIYILEKNKRNYWFIYIIK